MIEKMSVFSISWKTITFELSWGWQFEDILKCRWWWVDEFSHQINKYFSLIIIFNFIKVIVHQIHFAFKSQLWTNFLHLEFLFERLDFFLLFFWFFLCFLFFLCGFGLRLSCFFYFLLFLLFLLLLLLILLFLLHFLFLQLLHFLLHSFSWQELGWYLVFKILFQEV